MRYFIAVFLLILPVSVWSAIDTYEFKDDATRERFKQLTFELRCPKCQNQNLQDSNSPIASDLRNEVYKMLQEGNDDSEIVDFMVARYGEFVLYRPPVNKATYVLWYGPFGLVVIGIVVVLMVSKKRKRNTTTSEVSSESNNETHLSSDESERLKDLLDTGKNK